MDILRFDNASVNSLASSLSGGIITRIPSSILFRETSNSKAFFIKAFILASPSSVPPSFMTLIKFAGAEILNFIGILEHLGKCFNGLLDIVKWKVLIINSFFLNWKL